MRTLLLMLQQVYEDATDVAFLILVILIIVGLLSGCCERDILGDCIHRSPGSTNSLSVSELDTLCNGSDEQAQKVIQRHKYE